MVSPQTLNSFCINGLNVHKIVLISIFPILSLRNIFGVKRKSLPFSGLPRFKESTALSSFPEELQTGGCPPMTADWRVPTNGYRLARDLPTEGVVAP